MNRHRWLKSESGTTLGVTLVMTLVMAVMIGGYLSLLSSEYRMAHRQFYHSTALHIAEAGVEEAFAMLMYGNESWTSNGWTAVNSTNYVKTVTNLTEGSYVVTILNSGGAYPVIVSTGRIDAASATVFGQANTNIVRSVRATVKRQSYFRWGLMSQTTIAANGNAVRIDSFDSTDASKSSWNGLLGFGVYDSVKYTDNAYIACYSSLANSIGNSDIYGWVNTYSNGTVSCGPSGFLAAKGAAVNGVIDTNRVSRTLNSVLTPASLPVDFSPISNLGAITANTKVKGGVSSPVDYTINSISLSSGKELEFEDKVRVHVVGDADCSPGSMIVSAGGSVEMYLVGEAKLGSVINNAQQAITLQIYGLSNKAITLNGGAACTFCIYAPLSAVKLAGGGAASGAMVGYSIALNGNVQFHYDESLGEGAGDTYTLISWQEL